MYLRFPVTELYYSIEVISPDPNALELPPPLKPDSQDTSDTSPIYQGTNELPCKPNEVVDSEQCSYQEAHGLNDNVGTAKSDQQKVHFVFCERMHT